MGNARTEGIGRDKKERQVEERRNGRVVSRFFSNQLIIIPAALAFLKIIPFMTGNTTRLENR